MEQARNVDTANVGSPATWRLEDDQVEQCCLTLQMDSRTGGWPLAGPRARRGFVWTARARRLTGPTADR